MTASVWSDAYLLFAFACVLCLGFFLGKAYFQSKIEDLMLRIRFHCCDHCFDPTTGERMHASELLERHPTPCNEANCVKGRMAIV